jgi:uncharacterized protein YjiS (DUF1127 family)
MDRERTQLDRRPADAGAERLTAVLGGIRRLVSAAGEVVARWNREAATRSALMACSDRVLADIGIERDDTPAIARASIGRFRAEPVNWRDVLTQRLKKARLRRCIYQELMAYSDRELDELGLGRRDISEIARAA